MARGLHQVEHESRSGSPPSDANGADAPPSHRPALRHALASVTDGPGRLTPGARWQAVGAALEQRLGSGAFDAMLAAHETLLAGAPRPPRRRPVASNQLSLAFPATTASADTGPEAPRPATFRARPARRRWR